MELSKPSFSPARKWTIGSSVALSIGALCAIAVLINFISSRHFYRWDSRNAEPLSPQTVRVLKSITNRVSVIVYYDRRDPLFNSVSQLINQYKLACPILDVQYVDYRYPGRAETIRTQYKLGPDSEENRVIFDNTGRFLVVPARDLSIYDYSKLGTGEPVPRTGFKGEQLFTSALVSVLENRKRAAYILQAHGEHDPQSEDAIRGYSKFASLLERNNLSVQKLTGLVGRDVPDDCQLLVIPGPAKTFDPQEVDRVEKYLTQGGRLFVLFSYVSATNKTGLERLLAKWNIDVGFNRVIDPPQTQNENAILLTHFGSHPIANPLLNLSLLVVLPRSVSHKPSGTQSADAPKVVELAYTSAEGQAITQYGLDRTGSLPVMVAAEKGTIQGLGADKAAARLLVTGDSVFLSNSAFDYEANEDFANLAVNWLLNREILLGDIGPRAAKEYKLVVTEHQFSQLQWTFLLFVPGGVLLVGLVVWLKRRS